ERTTHRLVVAAEQVRDHHLVVPQLPPLAVQLEDSRELLQRRILDRNLVRDAPQERLVGQRFGIQVRREDNEHVERHLEFLPRVEREVVVPALERHDPSVEQIFGTNALTAKVVDQEHAAVRLQVNRRLVELRDRIERQIELVERQLAADHHHGTPDTYPPAIA